MRGALHTTSSKVELVDLLCDKNILCVHRHSRCTSTIQKRTKELYLEQCGDIYVKVKNNKQKPYKIRWKDSEELLRGMQLSLFSGCKLILSPSLTYTQP